MEGQKESENQKISDVKIEMTDEQRRTYYLEEAREASSKEVEDYYRRLAGDVPAGKIATKELVDFVKTLNTQEAENSEK